MTYNDLRAALSAYMHRSDAETIANEPQAIELARIVLGRSFFPEHASQLLPSLPLVSGSATLPDDFGQADVVVASGKGDLQYSPPRDFARKVANRDAAHNFTVTGTVLTADASVTEVAMTYYRTPPVIAGTATNWLSDNYPDVWLWAAIAEQHRFVQDFDSADLATGQWQAIAARAVDDTRANRGGGSMRMTTTR